MGLPVEKRRYTLEEYLRQESDSRDRHEFHNGEVLAMAGASYAHSKITLNIGGELRTRLRGTPCEPLDSNMRVGIPTRLTYVYPDITIICGEPQFDPSDKNQTTILNPRLVIEVLSDSTESYDRGAKFDLYRQIASVEEYMLVSQHQTLVETFFNQSDGTWLFNACEGQATSVKLRSLQITLPLIEIYLGVDLIKPRSADTST